MRILFAAAIAAGLVGTAQAAETGGCAAFAWPLDREIAMLKSADIAEIVAGAPASALPAKAVMLRLTPLAATDLEKPPERAPKTGDQAGAIRLTIATAGIYQITLTAPAWLDVVQAGSYLKPVAFSGVTDCAEARKSVRFDLAAGPVTIQVSDTSLEVLRLTVTPAGK